MLDTIKRFFQEHIAAEGGERQTPEHRLQLATAALLIEMSRADTVRHPEEAAVIERAIAEKFELTQAETAELVALAEEEAKQSVSDHGFIRLINEHFGQEQKARIVTLLWEVAYADGTLDKYEEHFVRRIADLLYVPHQDFIAAKLEVQARYAQ